MTKKKAVYPLSSDPVHNGHMHNLAVAVNSGFFDEVHFGMGYNSKKNYLFSQDEKAYLSKKAVESADLDSSKVKITSFSCKLI